MADETRRHRGPNDDAASSGVDPYTEYDDFDLPAYVGRTSFQKLPELTDGDALPSASAGRRHRRRAIR